MVSLALAIAVVGYTVTNRSNDLKDFNWFIFIVTGVIDWGIIESVLDYLIAINNLPQ